MVCASPHFQLVTVAGGLFRTVSHTPFVSLGNAAGLTYLTLFCLLSQNKVQALYPRSRVLRQQSTNPYVALGCIQLLLVTCVSLE